MPRRTKATQVWEIPVPSGTLRVSLNPQVPTQIFLVLADSDGKMVFQTVLDQHGWRALCDLRNVLRPARIRRDPH